MKKLCFIIIFILFTPLVEAKTILYITNASTDTPCSSLPLQDSLYCSRLVNLSYDVNVLNEQHVKEDSTTWNDYVNASNMIFLGNVSLDMVKTNKFQNVFCGNISSKLINKTLFAAFSSTWINTTSNISGCAFHPSINLVSFEFGDNRCQKKTFKVAKSGYITEDFNVSDNIDFYSTALAVKIHSVSNGGWITAECTPNNTIDFYPVINTSSKGVFWGLDNPSSFTADAWKIFDKTILESLNDTSWSITSIIIPSVTTVNQDVWVLANVTQFNKPITGIVNFTADDTTGNLEYVDGLWKNKTVKLTSEKQYSLSINAYSTSGLRSISTSSMTAGSLTVNITSGNYKPGSDYIISAGIFLGPSPQASSASYRVLSPSSYSVLYSGSLNCVENNCANTISSLPDLGDLIIEVTVSNATIGKSGGNFKIISKEPLVIEKNLYKPGETIAIDFFPSEPVNKTNLTIIRPDRSLETPTPIPMNNTSSTHWYKNYTLGTAAPNGTYIINVRATGNRTLEFNKTIDVIAWKSFAYLNQYSFYAYEILDLTVKTIESYSSNLNFSISVDIMDPENNKVFTTRGSVKGDGTYKTSYLIPRSYKNGLSNVKIFLSDSDNRNQTLYLNFTVNSTTTPNLLITPNIISELTISNKILEKSFSLENSAENINVTNLIINVSDPLKNMVSITSRPTFIQAKNKGEVKARVSTVNLSEGRYSGTIDFFSQVGDVQATISIEIVGDLSSRAQEKLNELLPLELNITDLKKRWANVTEALDLFNETKMLLDGVKKDFQNENYSSARTKLEDAGMKLSQLRNMISGLYASIPDYSFIIWDVAIIVVVIIILITVFKYRNKIKQLLKKEKKKEEKVEEFYIKPREEYRTEYY